MPQAVEASTTRRALFGTAAGATVAVTMPRFAMAASPMQLEILVAEVAMMTHVANTDPDDRRAESASNRVFEIDEVIRALPCNSKAAAAAKLDMLRRYAVLDDDNYEQAEIIAQLANFVGAL